MLVDMSKHSVAYLPHHWRLLRGLGALVMLLLWHLECRKKIPCVWCETTQTEAQKTCSQRCTQTPAYILLPEIKRGIIILAAAFMKTYWVIRGHYNIASSQVANLITSLQKAMTDWMVFSPTLCQNTFPIRHCRRVLDLSLWISWILSVNISF